MNIKVMRIKIELEHVEGMLIDLVLETAGGDTNFY